MTRGQVFGTAILSGVILGTVLEPTLGRWTAVVIGVAVAVAIDAGGRRLRKRDRDDGAGSDDAGRRRR